jgi:PKD repeat protein
MKNSKCFAIISIFLCGLIVFSGCKKDESTDIPWADYGFKTSDLTVRFSPTTPSPSEQEGSFTYSWNFGDGATSAERNPSHTYPYAGTFDVTLTVNNAGTVTKYLYHVTVPTATVSALSLNMISADSFHEKVSEITSIALNGTDLYAGTDSFGVFVTNNNGSSWTAIDSGFPKKTGSPADTFGVLDVKVYSMFANGSVFAGTSDGVYFLNNGPIPYWTQSGLAGQTVISIISSSTYLVAGTTTGIYYSSDNGATWTLGQTKTLRSLEGSGTNLIAASSSQVHRSTDGATWTLTSSNPPGGLNMQAAGAVDSLLFVSGNSVYRSNNGGTSWQVDTSFSNPVVVNSFLTVGSRIYAATSSGIYVNTNYFVTPSYKPWSIMALQGNSVEDIIINGSTIYALTTTSEIYMGTF